MISANDQLMHAADYRAADRQLSQWRRRRAVRCRQRHRFRPDGASLGLANGKRSALLIIFRQPGANIIDTVDGIKAALPQLHASINPPST